MTRVALVTGLPGAGKSSVLGAVAGDSGYKVLNLGEIMTRIAAQKGYAKDRDQLRYLTNAQTTELRSAAAEEVASQEGNVLLDTHAVREQMSRFVTGIPETLPKELKNVVALFYIDADIGQIMERRRKDKTRNREEEPGHVLDAQHTLSLAVLGYYASHLNIPLYVIYNEDGKLEAARKNFMEHLKDAFGEK